MAALGMSKKAPSAVASKAVSWVLPDKTTRSASPEPVVSGLIWNAGSLSLALA